MSEVEKICEFCEYEYEDPEGTHCRHCIHNAVENFKRKRYSKEYCKWIPFKQRELDEEEKEYYGDDIKYMLDCRLPEEDEEILVTYRFKDELYVDHDIFLRDGSECYLDSGREFITEAIAWMPKPEPYKEAEQKLAEMKGE